MSTTDSASMTPEELAKLTRVPRRHTGRWIAAAILVLLVGFIVSAFARGEINWSTVGSYLTDRTILDGLINTVAMTFLAMFVGITIGAISAIMRLSPNPVLRTVSLAYVWLFRGIPQLLQLYIWYNLALVFPTLGIPGIAETQTVDVMSPLVATVLGLGLCQGAYTSEVIRAGILSVDQGQIEAAQGIGMTRLLIMRRITMPQAMRVIIPPVGNEFISMVKLTSLASAIQYTEMLHSAQNIYFVSGEVMELLFVATFWYVVVVSLLSIAQHFIEKRFSRGYGPTRSSRRRPSIQSGEATA
ncbi:amino acid ABC transporter permease [Nocardioidaceae bacterium SCSIO 66511]|nr:amino acid ABC transporter permease [Nocardioidaceae bacterium SCSIO 66511]